ncbi:MAG: tetratricopeptide repeat protein, partial [Phycisphaerales bacterium]
MLRRRARRRDGRLGGEAAALLGSIYRTLGRYEKAVALWRRYRRLRTDDVGVRLRLIEALLL